MYVPRFVCAPCEWIVTKKPDDGSRDTAIVVICSAELGSMELAPIRNPSAPEWLLIRR